MGGPDRHTQPGDEYFVEINPDGTTEWERHDKEDKELGFSYALSGSFNDWDYDALESDEALAGLYSAIVVIGSTGEEYFYVVADQDPAMTFYPEVPATTMKSCPILGPDDKATKDFSWCIRGAPGDVFKVEFYVSEGSSVSITWYKTKAVTALRDGDKE